MGGHRGRVLTTTLLVAAALALAASSVPARAADDEGQGAAGPIRFKTKMTHTLGFGPERFCGKRYERSLDMRISYGGSDDRPTLAIRAKVGSTFGIQNLKLFYQDDRVTVLTDTSPTNQQFWLFGLSPDGDGLDVYNIFGTNPETLNDKAARRAFRGLDTAQLAIDLEAGRGKALRSLHRVVGGECGHWVDLAAPAGRQARIGAALGLGSSAIEDVVADVSARLGPALDALVGELAGRVPDLTSDGFESFDFAPLQAPDGSFLLPPGTGVLAQLDPTGDAVGCGTAEAASADGAADLTSILGMVTADGTFIMLDQLERFEGLDDVPPDLRISMELFGADPNGSRLLIAGAPADGFLTGVELIDGAEGEGFEVPLAPPSGPIIIRVPTAGDPLAMIAVDVSRRDDERGTSSCDSMTALTYPSPLAPIEPADENAVGGCTSGATSICLNDRIEVSVESTPVDGPGVSLDDVGSAIARLGFLDVDLDIRIFDTCDQDGRYWTEVTAIIDPSIDRLPATHRITIRDAQLGLERTFIYSWSGLPPEVRGSDVPPLDPDAAEDPLVAAARVRLSPTPGESDAPGNVVVRGVSAIDCPELDPGGFIELRVPPSLIARLGPEWAHVLAPSDGETDAEADLGRSLPVLQMTFE